MPNKINFFSRLIDFNLEFNNFILKRKKNTTGINKETNTKKLIKVKERQVHYQNLKKILDIYKNPLIQLRKLK